MRRILGGLWRVWLLAAEVINTLVAGHNTRGMHVG